MRKVYTILCVLSVAMVTLSSCKFDGKNEHTPSIYLSTLYKNPTGDSIGTRVPLTYHGESGRYLSDTLLLTDSVHMIATVYSYANNLQSFCVSYDTTHLLYSDLKMPYYDQVLLPTSDRSHGQYFFYSGFCQISFQFGFRADSVGTYPVTLHVTSDSEFPSASLPISLIFADK